MASTVTYFIPTVAVLIGVAVLGERLQCNAPVPESRTDIFRLEQQTEKRSDVSG